MAEHVSPFENWKSRSFKCPCGWTGSGNDLAVELHAELLDGSCPSCDKMLMIQPYPRDEDIESAAAQGNTEAIGMLQKMRQVQRERAATEKNKLRDPQQLPDLPDEGLEFVWSIDGENEQEGFEVVIRIGSQEVWRERALYENWERFLEVKAILKAKYGAAFKRMTPTKGAELYLYGDDLSASRKITYT